MGMEDPVVLAGVGMEGAGGRSVDPAGSELMEVQEEEAEREEVCGWEEAAGRDHEEERNHSEEGRGRDLVVGGMVAAEEVHHHQEDQLDRAQEVS